MRASEARKIPIESYLSSLGIKARRINKQGTELWYISPIRAGDTNPSFKVDRVKNLWFDFGVAKGGNVLDLVCELEQVGIKEALAVLDRSGLSLGITSLSPAFNPISFTAQSLVVNKKVAGEKEKKFDVLAVGEIDQAFLVDFLRQRKITLKLAKKYLHQLHYRPVGGDRAYFALAWACGEGFEVRSPFFKGFIGEHKALIDINLKNHLSVSIFEGFMDFLAFLSYYNKTDFKNSVIILNSVSLKKRALELIKKYDFSKVYLFLDNDEAGKNTRDFFKQNLVHLPVVDKSGLYSDYKDFNDMCIEVEKK